MSAPFVLLVEDSPEDAANIVAALSQGLASDQVKLCKSGEEALALLHGEPGARAPESLPALLLLDLGLPRMSGFDVLRQIRASERTRLLPVIVLSASVETADVRRAIELGANSYIRKSLDTAKLADHMNLIAQYWLTLNIPPPAPPATGRN